MHRDGEGRWALVTGASAGIGSAFARVLAERGYSLVLTARREERLAELGAELRASHGVEHLVVAADLADPAAPERIGEAVDRAGARVDLLVNNAGYGHARAFHETPWPEHAAFLQVLVTSVVHLCHRFIGPMLERRWGRIINVASLAGLMPGTAKRTLYGPSKAMLVRFSEALAAEHRHHGVHVTALCPGFTYSEFHDVAGNRAQVSRLPRLLWMDADTVARQGYDAVMAGREVFVTGVPNKLVALAMRLTPPALARTLLGREARALSADEA